MSNKNVYNAKNYMIFKLEFITEKIDQWKVFWEVVEFAAASTGCQMEPSLKVYL